MGWFWGNSGRRPYYGFGRYMGHFTPETVDLKKDPFFFEPSEHEWVRDVEANWTVIRDELEQYLNRHNNSLIPYFGDHLMSSKKCWRALGLKFWNIYHPEMPKVFPRTMAIFERIPHMVSVSFSQIQPNSAIKPHFGDTNANYRCHLGLIVPAGLPDAGMEIGDQQQEWKEGRVFAFNDAHYHRAWNKCDERRFVLILDVMRREHMPKRNHVCRYVMASFLLQRIANMCSIVKATKWTEHYTHAILYCLLFVPVNLGLGSSFVHWFMRA